MFIIAIYVNSTIDSSLNTGAKSSVTIMVQRIAAIKWAGYIAYKTMTEVVKNFSSSVYGSKDEVSVLSLQRDRVGWGWRRLGLFGEPWGRPMYWMSFGWWWWNTDSFSFIHLTNYWIVIFYSQKTSLKYNLDGLSANWHGTGGTCRSCHWHYRIYSYFTTTFVRRSCSSPYF